MPWSPTPSEPTEKAEQLVGLIMKFGLLMLTWISTHPDRDAADDLGHRFGVGDHVGVERGRCGGRRGRRRCRSHRGRPGPG